MDVSEAKPRVNFELLARYMNRKVLLVGKIEDLEGGRAKVRAADGGQVFVELTKGPSFDGGELFEFEGLVQSPNTIREESRTSYGERFDFSTYNELCKLASGQYRGVFL